MAVSIRSQLLAGSAAMVTAATVTVSGMTAAGSELPFTRVAALENVKLAAFASPLLEIFDTIQRANLYTFSIVEFPLTTPAYTYYGVIPDWLGVGFPIVTQYALNASDYPNQTINYLIQDAYPLAPTTSQYPGALRILTWAVDALPTNIGYATQQLFAGNLVGALQTAKFAIINPIQAALYQTLNSGMYVLGGVGVRAAAVITAVAEWIPEAIRHVADSVTVIGNAAFNVLGNVAYGIQTGNPEVVWNSLVVGLLGTANSVIAPTVPDALINQTIGEGGRLYSVPGVTYEPAPSIREDLTTLRDNIAEALATDVPQPADPPFPVSFPGFGVSQIPTPWQQTPYPAAAVRRPTVARTAAAAAPAAAKNVAKNARARSAR